MTVPSAILRDDASRLWTAIRDGQFNVETIVKATSDKIGLGTAVGRNEVLQAATIVSDYVRAIMAARAGGPDIIAKVVDIARQEIGDPLFDVVANWATQRNLAVDILDGVVTDYPVGVGGWLEREKFIRDSLFAGDLSFDTSPAFPAASTGMQNLKTNIDLLLADIV